MSDADPAIIDTATLDDLQASVDGDRGFVTELIEAYLADAPTQLAGIESAIDGLDANALVRPAHTLKSSSATLGLMRLSGLARELEMAGREGSLDASIGDRLAPLRSAWTASQAALRSWAGDEPA